MLCVFYRKYYVNCLDMTCNITNFGILFLVPYTKDFGRITQF